MGVKEAIVAIVSLWLAAGDAQAQAAKDQSTQQTAPPKTKIEAFTGESGAVLVKGYTSTGIVRGRGSVEISAMTFRNAKTGEETKGLSITLSNIGTYVSDTSAFVDYDEIAGLLAGIDYISGTDTSSTKLANFEAIYSTRGNLKITVFNDSAATNAVAVDVNRYTRGAFLKMSDLAKIRDAVAAAKQILDNPDSVAAKGARLAGPSESPLATSAPSSPPVSAPRNVDQSAAPQPAKLKARPAQPGPGAPMKLN